MATVVGQLKVLLGLDTAAFESGAIRAAKQSDAMGDRVEHLGNRVGSLGKVMVGAAAAFIGTQLFSTMKDLVTEGLKYASSLQEQAQQLGVLASEMQEYRYAASQFGIDNAQMDQGLQQLTKRIGLAAAGAKAPKSAFEELGISLRDASGHMLTAGQAIPLIAGALSKIPDPAARARLEVALFGKAGQTLDPLMTQGAAGVNKLRHAAHELGIVLSDKAIANADETADKMDAMNQVLKAKLAGFVAENSKEILALATALTDLAGAALKALGAYMKFRELSNKRVAQHLRADAYTDRNAAVPASRKSAVKAQAREIIDKNLGYKEKSVGGFWGAVGVKRTSQSGNLAGSGMLGGNSLSRFAPGLGVKGGMELLSGRAIIDGLEQTRDGIDGISESTEQVRRDSKRATEDLQQGWVQTAQTMVGALDRVSGAFRGGSWLDKASALIGLAVQIKGAFFPGSAAQYAAGMPTGRAGGGQVAANRMYRVGEHGPEMFVSGQGGRIIPNHALGKGGGVTNVFQGNLLTPEWWAIINRGNEQAAQAGARGGEARMMYRGSRRLS